ncbi:PEP-CTERM sorting domain-containing protein [Fundidesulfovibrio putealis]|uniref:PEP-CTERM sorting domain-containing protein n=1 Tax=Fundidesulfovibrio putealis TaxID=270496 RepID=UPI000480470E|nr:PEP-CTERM sorting domain-containing protein [Fundidesulfovibrio putealis]
MRLMRLALILAIAFSFPQTSFAAVILDQSNLYSYSSVTGSSHFQQQITVGTAGILDHIDLYTSAGTINIRIKMGNAVQTSGPWLYDQVLVFGVGTNTIDLSSLALSVNPGDAFVLDWNGASGGAAEPNFGVSFSYQTPDYAGGDLWKIVGTTATFQGVGRYGLDMRFQTFVQEQAVPVATPEPATMALLGVGLAGLVMVRRRKAA